MYGVREFSTKNGTFAIVDFPFSTDEFIYRGINLTLIILAPLEIGAMDVVCDRFINLSTVTCRKVAIQAKRYINLGEILYNDLDKNQTSPNIRVGSTDRYTSLEVTDKVRKKVFDKFWNAIDDVGILEKKMKEATEFLEEFVKQYSPRLLRKV